MNQSDNDFFTPRDPKARLEIVRFESVVARRRHEMGGSGRPAATRCRCPESPPFALVVDPRTARVTRRTVTSWASFDRRRALSFPSSVYASVDRLTV
jgi:hypothetical protein